MIVVGGAMIATVNILFLARTLSFSPATIGMLAVFTGAGTMIGAALAGRAARLLTLGGAIVAAGFLESFSLLLTPSAAIVPNPFVLLAITGVLTGIAYSVLSINQISLRQRITHPRLLGRVTAARRFLIFCVAPLGAAAGGWMGTNMGLEVTLFAGGGVTTLASIYMWFSPIRMAA
jgi:predicted MFS family arabinose efflux permease